MLEARGRTACSHCRLSPSRSASVGSAPYARSPAHGWRTRRHVHPDLVGAAGLQLDVEQADRAERLDRVVVRHRGTAARDDRPAPVAGGVPVDRRVDGAAQRVRQALDQRVVALVDGALFEGALEQGVGRLALGHDHRAGGVGVEAVHDALAFGGAAGGDRVAGARAVPPARWARSSRASGARRRRWACRSPRCRRPRAGSPCPAPAAGAARGADGGAGSVTSSHEPACMRSDLAPAWPSTSTSPDAMTSAARVRESPNRRASAASRRSPSSPSGTGRLRCSAISVPRPGGRSRARGPRPRTARRRRRRRGAPCRPPAGRARPAARPVRRRRRSTRRPG